MILVDVNILVYAHRTGAKDHERYREWVLAMATGPEAFGLSDQVLGAFVRIVTNPKIYPDPTPLADALTFADRLRSRPNCVRVQPGPRHWELFADLCRRSGARGNLVSDAWFAALAIESGSEWITEDRDYSRFPGLRWRRPFGDRVGESSESYRTGKAREREFLLELVRRNGRSLARAAKAAEMDRRLFSVLLRKHRIPVST